MEQKHVFYLAIAEKEHFEAEGRYSTFVEGKITVLRFVKLRTGYARMKKVLTNKLNEKFGDIPFASVMIQARRP